MGRYIVTAVLTSSFLASVDRVSDDANALRPGALGAAEHDPPTGGGAVVTAGDEVVLDEARSDGEYPGDVGSTGRDKGEGDYVVSHQEIIGTDLELGHRRSCQETSTL